MPKSTYYIDSIYRSEGSDPAEGYITLISTDADEEGSFIPYTIPFNTMPMVRAEDGLREVRENTYVYLSKYNPDEPVVFEDRNTSPYAEQQFSEMAELRQLLDEAYSNATDELTEEEFLILTHPTEIYSYHVNVGHGNCSLILVKSGYKHILWMVDASTMEGVNFMAPKTDHSSSLHQCLEEIAQRVDAQISQLHINRFFLTHPHYDHFNGVFYLHKIGLLDKDTVYYINYYYDCSCEPYKNYLQYLYKNKYKIIEPTEWNCIASIMYILHPERRIFRTDKLLPSSNRPYRVVENVNNASVVYCFCIGDRTMIFPGDLQHEGFDAMTKDRSCCYRRYFPDYYAISHHGSGNGHPQQRCMSHHRPLYPLRCLTSSLKKAVLMGRDGAYSKIFDSKVTAYFSNKGELVSTDMRRGKASLHYLRLNWLSGYVDYKFE